MVPIAAPTPMPTPAAAPTPAELVRDAYGRLAREDEASVRLVRIRADLAGTLTDDQITEALLRMRRDSDIS